MANVSDHYRELLADVYSWMLGGFDTAVARNADFFARLDLRPRASAVAFDLGAGCGFQSLPLARLGFRVTAIDLDQQLLTELEQHRDGLPIRCITDDLLNFDSYVDAPVELAVCMTDTLLHLETTEAVGRLLRKVSDTLMPGGRFIATFRDLSSPLEDLGRFLPVRSDADTILTCFLEYESAHVRVHDLLYRRLAGQWRFSSSWYRKLRLSVDAFRQCLTDAGLHCEQITAVNGLVTAVAHR